MVFQLTQKLVFPDPHYGEPDGLLAVGGDLSVDRLLLAYSNGIFPWYAFQEKSLWHLQNIKNERALHKIQKVGNDMATVLISAFCSALHSNNSSAAKVMRICE